MLMMKNASFITGANIDIDARAVRMSDTSKINATDGMQTADTSPGMSGVVNIHVAKLGTQPTSGSHQSFLYSIHLHDRSTIHGAFVNISARPGNASNQRDGRVAVLEFASIDASNRITSFRSQHGVVDLSC